MVLTEEQKKILLWERKYSFYTQRNMDSLLSALKNINGQILKGMSVSVTLYENNNLDNRIAFKIETYTGFVKLHLLGQVSQESRLSISGIVGVDTRVLFLFLMLPLMIGAIYFSLESPSIQILVGLIVCTVSAMAFIIIGLIVARNALLEEFRKRVI